MRIFKEEEAMKLLVHTKHWIPVFNEERTIRIYLPDTYMIKRMKPRFQFQTIKNGKHRYESFRTRVNQIITFLIDGG